MFRSVATLLIACALGVTDVGAKPASKVDPLLARGKYLVQIGACNDCHTPGWRSSDGNVPVASWMTGSQVGLREHWGTDYPINVRVWFHVIDESAWLFAVKTRGGRMQWHDLRHLTVDDQRAIYRFVRSLGPKGQPAPQDVPANREPKTPYIDLRVHSPARSGAI